MLSLNFNMLPFGVWHIYSAYHGPAGHVAEGCKKAAEKKANIKAEEKKLGDAAERRKIQKRFVDKWLAVSEYSSLFPIILYTNNIISQIARKMNREKARKRKEKAAVKAAEKAAKSSE